MASEVEMKEMYEVVRNDLISKISCDHKEDSEVKMEGDSEEDSEVKMEKDL